MTTTVDPPAPIEPSSQSTAAHDHRGFWLPTGTMIAAKVKDLRKRRGLMVTLVAVTVGIPAIYFAIQALLHALAPKTYGPAGGYDSYVGVVNVLYVFGFVVAATLGATAGSADLTEGMFRHHVITGRSRIALYLARIPSGLAIIVPLTAIGFTVVCVACTSAPPTSLEYNTVPVPAQLSQTAFQKWAAENARDVVGYFPSNIPPKDSLASSPCLPGGPISGSSEGAGPASTSCTPAELQTLADFIARQDYIDYNRYFLSPSVSLMVTTGLWIELEAFIGFMVGLGLASLLGQRTIPVVLLIVVELVITPIEVRAKLPHLSNLQRSVVGVASNHLEPGWLPAPFGGVGGPTSRSMFVSESTAFAVCVIVGWILVWTALGMWRMATRDA